MKTFLMCEPRFFDVNYIINPWMSSHLGQVDKELAATQWQQLYNTLTRKANIKLIEPVAGLPDMVFTANAGLVTNNRDVVIANFRHPERQGESAHFREFFAAAQYQIKPMAANYIFEGAGDALFDEHGELWFGSGPRSDVHAITQVARLLQVNTHALQLVNPRWYHLDTAFCPLTGGYAIAYAKAFSADSVALIQNKFGDKVIWVSDEDAENFACNAVCLEQEIILNRASDALKTRLTQLNFRIIEINVSEFIKSGGSCKCLTLEI